MEALTKNERKEMKQYSYRFKKNGKRVSKKSLVEEFGKDRIERMMLETAREFFEDPYYTGYYMCGVEVIPSWK